MSHSLNDFDSEAPEDFDSGHGEFARLRREDPVHYHPESPFGPYWSVTRYADIMKVELDPGIEAVVAETGPGR